MPLYEYRCPDCEASFDVLRGMADADRPITCPKCGGRNARRAISLFSAIGGGKVIAGTGAGSSCGSCTPSASCASCAARSSR